MGVPPKEVLHTLQRIVVGLEADPALLDGFQMYPWAPRPERTAAKPIVIDVDDQQPDEGETAEDTVDANQIVSDTAALSAFTKHFNFDGLVPAHF